MTTDQLDRVVTSHGERWRYLTSDANPDAAQREAYRALVVRLASGVEPSPDSARRQTDPHRVPLASALTAQRLGYAKCWMSTRDDACGCSGVRCHLLGRVVSLRDCVRCLDLPLTDEPTS